MFPLVLALALSARADVLPDDDIDCPRGSLPDAAHSGVWCEASTCSAATDCPDGYACKSVALCVETYEKPCGGMQEDTAEPCTFTVNEAHGTCKSDGDCDAGTCQEATRCVAKAACGGCSTGGAAGFAGAVLALGLLVGLGRRA